MKFAYMVATPEIEGEKVTALKGNCDELFAKIKAWGYDGVELMMKNPFLVNFREIERISQRYELFIPVVCTGEMYGEDGISLSDPDPEVRKETIRRLSEIAIFAEEIGAFVNVGRVRGKYRNGILQKDIEQWAIEGLNTIALRYPKVHFLIEPINRQYENFILTTEEGVGFIKQICLPNVRLMLDYMHMLIEGENVEESISLAISFVEHIHVCDSDRLPLGRGNFDLTAFFHCLIRAGYDDFISIESFPSQDIDGDLELGITSLRKAFYRAKI